ncbi:hypothetical protein AJ80_05366 [Polytolypa hystricis UAMH7299]|uniref:Uncharacterized protein n=1 Tax=Polytolypa hystricis (strain UAMH7299) TaxID=1447883 RepID=A0A2B7Y423_POLH7|nr:hypothetical protein AJ80_05366 [Polytolypa hystricis UAMH7299]
MDLFGLICFSISMAMIGNYHAIPFTSIQPGLDFPMRMFKGIQFGYLFGTIGEILDIYIPTELAHAESNSLENTSLTNPSTLSPLETFIRNHSVPVSMVSPISSRSWTTHTLTCPVPSSTLASGIWVSLTTTFLTTTDVPTAEVVTPLSEISDGPWQLHEGLHVLPSNRRTFIESILLAFYATRILVAMGVSFIILLSTYTLYEQARLDFFHVSSKAKTAMYTFMIEAGAQMSEMSNRLNGVKTEMDGSLDKLMAQIQEEKAAALQRIAESRELHEEALEQTRNDREYFAKLADQMWRDHLPLPSPQDLLKEHITGFKQSLVESKEELDQEIDRLGLAIPGLIKTCELTVADLKRDKLGNIPNAMDELKDDLLDELSYLRDLKDALPDLKDLVRKVELETSDMEADLSGIQDRNDRTKKRIMDLEWDNSQLQARLARLEEELALSCMATKAANESSLQDYTAAESHGFSPTLSPISEDTMNEILGGSVRGDTGSCRGDNEDGEVDEPIEFDRFSNKDSGDGDDDNPGLSSNEDCESDNEDDEADELDKSSNRNSEDSDCDDKESVSSSELLERNMLYSSSDSEEEQQQQASSPINGARRRVERRTRDGARSRTSHRQADLPFPIDI